MNALNKLVVAAHEYNIKDFALFEYERNGGTDIRVLALLRRERALAEEYLRRLAKAL